VVFDPANAAVEKMRNPIAIRSRVMRLGCGLLLFLANGNQFLKEPLKLRIALTSQPVAVAGGKMTERSGLEALRCLLE
jgi:hypothetical protein